MRFDSTLSFLLLAALFALSDRAEAGEQDGVHCPAGFDAVITDGNRALKCIKKAAFELASSCPIGWMMAGGDNKDSTDKCFKFGDVQRVMPSVPAAGPPWFPPASRFKRVVRGDATKDLPDVFIADDYKFPEAGPIYVGDALKGVRCPSGWDGDVRFSGRGIRCDRNDGSPREADCDPGWMVDRDRLGSEDRCLGINEGPTKAMGMTKIQFDAERALPTVGWLLSKRTGTDQWQRKLYRYPAAVE